jgi:YD repeat-containing protein
MFSVRKLAAALVIVAFTLPSGQAPPARADTPTAGVKPNPSNRAPVPLASTPRPISVGRTPSSASEFPADPHSFGRHHAPPMRPTGRGLAHKLLPRALRAARVPRSPLTRGNGPVIRPGAVDPRTAPKNVGAVVVAYMTRHPSTPTPSPTPVTLSRRRVGPTSASRRIATIDITQKNVTGINHWWSYEEGAIPGVGRWMVNAYSGNLIVQADDMDVAHRGIDLAFRRTYNSFSRHDFAANDGATAIGQYGSGWTNTFDAHISTNGCPNAGYSWAGFYGFSVHDIDGARYDYCFSASGQLISPPGMQGASLVANPDGGSFYWTKKNGTQYTFYAPYYGGTSTAYSGRIYRISGRNQNNYIQFTYGWNPDASANANLTNIYATTDNGGSQATLTFANFNGNQLLSQLTRPDGTTITYDYDSAGELIAVSKPAPNNSGIPAVETYNGYQSFLMVTSPRWNAGAENDGGYVAFSLDETTTAQVNGIEWAGVVNFVPNDGTGTLLQPSVAGGPILYRWEGVTVGPNYTSFNDTDGHGEVQYFDGAGRPTTRSIYTGSQWLQTSEAWDANNNLTATVDARGNETDFAYDAAGNTIAVGEPQVSTSEGTFRPTKLFDYDGFNNVLAYCDQHETHQAGADWTVPPVSAQCASRAASVPHASFAFSYPSPQPYGRLESMTTPMGYTHRLSYAPAQQAGNPYGLPTAVTGDPITQLDGTTVTPTQTFWYDANGNLRCYSKGNGTWALSYDNASRLVMVADPDDSSANAGTLCGKSTGQAGWNTQTTYTYNPDGSKASAQTPSERAYGLSTTYAYDLDGNVVSETAHHGCVPNQTCPPGTTQKWYDGADRLVEVQLPHDPRSYSWPSTLPYDGVLWVTRYLYDISAGGTVSLQGSAPFRAYGNLYKTQKGVASSFTDVSGSAFDALDRETTKLSFLVGSDPGTIESTQLQYDGGSPAALGVLTQKTNPAGESVSYGYDNLNRVLTQTYAGDNGVTPAETTVYDANGRAASVNSSRFGTQQYHYDADGRLSSTTEPGGGGVTGAAQIAYSYYGDGKRSAVSITSPGFNQANALTYSYRADGQMQTQAVNAFASGTWTKDYTDAGRLRSIAGAGAPTRAYDTTGQLQSYNVVGQAIAYTHDPEGSVLSESFPSVWPAGAPAPVSFVRYSTINVRGELIDDTPPGTAPGAWMAAHRVQTNSGCMARQTVTGDGSYDPTVVPEQDGRQCVVTSTGIMGAVDYNGASFPSGTTTQFSFDAVGRLSRTINDHDIFFGGDPGDPTRQNPPHSTATATATHTTTGTSYDAENHTIARQIISSTETRTKPDQNLTTTTSSGPGLATTLGWGPNGHPIVVHDPSQPTTAAQSTTLHWDGDMVLFITDANGSMIDFKAGLDGDITPHDATWAGLTIYDRDVAGVILASRNATGQSGLAPLDPFDGGDIGASFSGPSGFKVSASVQALYARPDGFKIADIQINGVRAFDPKLGSWTTPDAFEGDIHDPASQQKYMWNRGNAVDYSDPSGYCAGVLAVPCVVAGAVEAGVTAAGVALGGALVAGVGILVIAVQSPAGETNWKARAPASNAAGGQLHAENTNPYKGPVDKPVTAVDGKGNAIPVEEGQSIGSSPDSKHQQVKGVGGRPTGVRLDGAGHPNQPDPKAQVPHAHRPGITDSAGNPHLPINH